MHYGRDSPPEDPRPLDLLQAEPRAGVEAGHAKGEARESWSRRRRDARRIDGAPRSPGRAASTSALSHPQAVATAYTGHSPRPLSSRVPRVPNVMPLRATRSLTVPLTRISPALCAIRDSVADIGLRVRIGVHTGECEVIEGKLAGLAVVIGSRVAAHAIESACIPRAADLRPAFNVRLERARGRRLGVRAGPDHGDERANDRAPLRNPVAGLRGRDPREARRARRSFGPRAGHGRRWNGRLGAAIPHEQ